MSGASVRVGVLGGGGFGQGLAAAAARARNDVLLWSRSERELPGGVGSTRDLAALAECDVLFLAVPSGYVEALSTELGTHLDGSHVLVHVSRGLVGAQLGTLSQLLRTTTPCRRVGALAGPLIAEALVSGAPSGAVVGTRFPEVANLVRDAIASEGFASTSRRTSSGSRSRAPSSGSSRWPWVTGVASARGRPP